jgi:hypothetical protein
VPQQAHLELSVTTAADLAAQRERVVALGARDLLDRSDDPDDRCTSSPTRRATPSASSWRRRPDQDF